MRAWRRCPRLLLLVLGVGCGGISDRTTPSGTDAEPPRLHHVHLNSFQPDSAIAWYLRLWPTAERTVVAGMPAVAAEMLLLFNAVEAPPPGGWNRTLHRAVPQSAFWHIGGFINTTGVFERLASESFEVLPLFTAPDDTIGVHRSGLAPYDGIKTAAELLDAQPAEPREGGFGYVVGPDGALVELTGGPRTAASFSHIHFYHEQPRCAANWYVEHLGMVLPPERNANGDPVPREPWSPCDAATGPSGWPSLEPGGTIREPRAAVQHGSGSMSWYPRQCVRNRCGEDTPLVRSRGQVLDHVAFAIPDLDSWYERLRAEGVAILEGPYAFGEGRAFLIEDLDGLAIELVDANHP